MKDTIGTTIANQLIEEIQEKGKNRRYLKKVLYQLLVVAFCILLSAAICILPELPGWTLVFCIVAVGAALLVGTVFYAVWPAIMRMILFFDVLLCKHKDYADAAYIKLDDWMDRQKDIWVKRFMAIAVLFAFVVFSLWLKDGRYIQWALGAAAALAICRTIWLIHKNFDRLENNKDILLGTVTASVTVLLGLAFWVPQVWGFSLPDITAQDLLGYYAAQLSLTFISISVMSVLSDRSVVIYWENVAQRKLIKPVFASFASYTYYSIGTTVGAGISVLLGKAVGFYVFFSLNVLVLILLTLTMVDVYYGREKKKDILKKQLMQESLAYQKEMDLYFLISKKYNSKDKDSSVVQKLSQDYEKHMLLFQQNIYRAREEHDLVFLQEAFDLCVEFRPLFTGVNGLKAYRMITYEHNGETWQVLQTRLSSEVEKQERELSGTEKYFDEELKWAADEWIWTQVVSSRYLREWLRNFGSGYDYQMELWDFMMLVLRRFVLLFNQMALDYNTKQDNGTEKPPAHSAQAKVLYIMKLKESMGNEWIPILHVEEKHRRIQAVDDEGKIPQYEICRKVMDGYMFIVTEEPYLLAKLVEIVAVMLQELGDYYRECLVSYYRDFPMFQVITRYFPMLNMPHYQEVWEKAFPSKKDPEEE